MRYVKNFEDLYITEDTVLSLGKFDGLHRGHKLLMDALSEKKQSGLKAAVFTFDIPPSSAAGRCDQRVITTNEEKLDLFRQRGVDYLIECPFTPKIMHMEAEDFIREIVNRLRVKWLVVGTDFHFGHNRRGDFHMLQAYADPLAYQVQVVSKMQYAGRDISSTYIREELEKGRLELANKMLGYPYFIEGTVIQGNRIGRTIGFPTINIQPPPQKLLPPFGVYVSDVQVDGQYYRGITNIGKKPTVHGNHPVGVETFIYDFHRDIYAKKVRVRLLQFVRPEQKFSGLEELKSQLAKDIAYGKQI